MQHRLDEKITLRYSKHEDSTTEIIAYSLHRVAPRQGNDGFSVKER